MPSRAHVLHALSLVFILGAAAFASLLIVPAAHALRLVDYSLEDYPTGVPSFDDSLRAVMAPIGADILVTEEMNPPNTSGQTYVDQFRNNVLDPINPGDWASAPFTNGNDQGNGMFYRISRVQLLGSWSFYATDVVRLINVYRVKPVGYTSGASEFRLYVIHLKAGSSSTDLSRRLTQATTIRDSMNAMPPGTQAILVGDYNMRSNQEAAFRKFVESQVNNTGRLYDPLNVADAAQTWYNNSSFATIHTQCPCVTPGTDCSSGFAGGGLDDRFDLFLPTYNFGDGQGLDILTATYKPVGNDGLHFNGNIRDLPEIPEGRTYANVLQHSSEHLPGRVDLQLPAQIGPVAALSFGSAIVGASVSLNASVPDTAQVPADSLRFTTAADPGFTAPAGPQAVAAGSAANASIGLNTATAGVKSGNLTIASNDADHPTTLVALAGTVLDHAAASLDSLVPMLADSIDFGTQTAGAFIAQDRRVHDRGYGALEARLSLNAANFAGGDGRFSIVGGFSPSLIAGVGRTLSIAFNDAGATADSEYTATLTLSSTDEPLPGTTAQPDLVISMKAQLSSGTVGVETPPPPPQFTRLYAPFPNPLSGSSTVRFDLALAAQARLEVFDLSGRRVTKLADRAFDPGRYSVRWDGRGEGGRALGPGLYFVRLSGPGIRTEAARIAIVR
ncbi:MAG: choice-of-anchor D domain-containing protein [Candidatus Eisenbacteria bacterium]|nr:choice-of-anchor D domain-containing protein [Candidatus Eisenbacteria bacterium]